MTAERNAWRFLSASTRRLAVLLGGALLIVAACQQPFDSSVGDLRGSSMETGGRGPAAGSDSSSGDQSSGGSSSSNDYRAVFLPPLAEDTGDTDAGVRVDDLAVRVRGVDSEGNTLDIPDFTADGHGSERLREASDVQHSDYYIVNLHLRRYVNAGSSLTIEIVRGESVIASLDAEVVANGREAREVSDAVALVSNRTVPVKFRVEQDEEPDLPPMPPAVVGIDPKPEPLNYEAGKYEDHGYELYTLELEETDDEAQFHTVEDLPEWIVLESDTGEVRVYPRRTDLSPGQSVQHTAEFYSAYAEGGDTAGEAHAVTFEVYYEAAVPPAVVGIEPEPVPLNYEAGKYEDDGHESYTLELSEADDDAEFHTVEALPNWIELDSDTGEVRVYPRRTDLSAGQSVQHTAEFYSAYPDDGGDTADDALTVTFGVFFE